MNKPVDFYTAKLLKEKGFKEPVVKCYATFKENIVIHSIYNSEIPEDMNGTRHEIIPNVYPNPPYYSAPTIAQVIMWLYEKHGIWIIATPVGISTTWCFSMFNVDPEKGRIIFESPSCNSPTEAYEAAIKHTLKNLI